MVLAQFHVAVVFVLQIFELGQLLQIGGHLLQFHVCLIVIKGDDGHSIFRLETIAVSGLHYKIFTLSTSSTFDRSLPKTRRSFT